MEQVAMVLDMINGRDIVVLLALARAPERWTVRSLGAPIGVGSGALHRSLGRLTAVGLYEPAERRVNAAVANELIHHGLRFLLSRELGGEVRGVPTAWGAEPLSGHLAGDGAAPVWPSAGGTQRGPALEPLVANAVDLLEAAPDLARDLALIDAIRVGGARDRALATELLAERVIGAIA